MTLVSDIKLIRTDTTLDLSQKAEKGMPLLSNPALFILPIPLTRLPSLWDKSHPSLFSNFYVTSLLSSLRGNLANMSPTMDQDSVLEGEMQIISYTVL
jgi:hypothetical protein